MPPDILMSKNEFVLDFKADKSTIKRSALNSIVIQVLFKLKGLITIPIMTYYLVPQEMGIFNIIMVTSSMLTPLFSMNLTDGPAIYLVQEKSKERIKDMYNTVINSSLLFSLFYALILWLIMFQYSGEYYKYFYLILIVVYSNILYKLFSYILAVFQKTNELVKNTFYKDLTATLLTVLFVIAGFSYYGILFALISTNILAGFCIYSFTKKELPYRPYIDWEILRTFLKISLPLLPVFFFSWIIQSSDSYFLAYYISKDAVGKYSVVYGLTNVILVLTYALNLFWYPVSARLWIENREKYRKTFIKVFFAFSILLFIGILLFELNSKAIMRIIVRRAEYHDAYAIMGIIAFAFALQVLITLLTAPLYSNKNVKSIFFPYLMGGTTNIILNFLFIPSMGISGAAISTAVSYLIVVVMFSYFNYRYADFPFLEKRLIFATGIFLSIWAGIYLLKENINFYQMLLADILLLFTLGGLLYFKGIRRDEREYLHVFLKGIRLKKA